MKNHKQQYERLDVSYLQGDPEKVIDYLQGIVSRGLIKPEIILDVESDQYSYEDHSTVVNLLYWVPLTKREIEEQEEAQRKFQESLAKQKASQQRTDKIDKLKAEIRTLKHVKKKFGLDISKELEELEEELVRTKAR